MRHAAWVIPPLVLAAVLGLSAVTKWGRGNSLHDIIRNLYLPAWVLPSWLAPAIPAVEVALALGLLAPWRPVFAVAAVGTTALMVAYWGLIARGLTLTPRPTCGCFGRVGDHRISGRTLLRNTLLVAAAVASVAVAASAGTAWSLMGDGARGDWLWLALAILACAVTGLVVARSDVPAQPMGTDPVPVAATPPSEDDDDYVRRPTPTALLHAPDSGPITLHELSASKAQLLVFVNCYCASTREAAEAIGDWQARLAAVDVRLVFSVPIPRRTPYSLPPGTLLDHAGIATAALGLRSSPCAVLLGADGALAGGPVSGMQDIRMFVDDIEESLSEVPMDVDGGSLDASPAEERQLTSDR
jgi:hypothetical protein